MTKHITSRNTLLSSLISNPTVRAAFQRAERDYGRGFAVLNEPKRTLDGGAAECVRELELV